MEMIAGPSLAHVVASHTIDHVGILVHEGVEHDSFLDIMNSVTHGRQQSFEFPADREFNDLVQGLSEHLFEVA